jgi:hypothetical protein
MTTLLALRSPTSVADAYGVVTSAAWDLPIDEAAPDLVQRAQIQLLLTLKGGVARPSFTEVTFASSDIVGTFEVTQVSRCGRRLYQLIHPHRDRPHAAHRRDVP